MATAPFQKIHKQHPLENGAKQSVPAQTEIPLIDLIVRK